MSFKTVPLIILFLINQIYTKGQVIQHSSHNPLINRYYFKPSQQLVFSEVASNCNTSKISLPFASNGIINVGKTTSTMCAANDLKFGVIKPKKPNDRFTFVLSNKRKTSKLLVIGNKPVTLLVDETNISGGALSRLNSTECFLDSVKNDSLVVTVLNEEIEIENRNKVTSITNSYFSGSFTRVHKSIHKDDILYLQTRNTARILVNRSATVLMAIAISCIVGSPLAGWRQTGDERIETREKVFTAGLACFGVSVPLFVLSKPKKYPLSEKLNTRQNNYWLLTPIE